MLDESEKETVHRLEAFSDIVIGFSLAQLGGTLVITKDVSIDPKGIIAFCGTFAIICSLWYFHHRVFQWSFVPKGWPIVLNFLWLATVVLLVFAAAQLSRSGFMHRNLDELYFALYALAYGILALQTLLGTRYRRDAPPDQRAKAVRSMSILAYWALIFGVNFALVYAMPPVPALGMAINATFAVAVAGNILIGVYFRRARRKQAAVGVSSR